MTNINHIMLPAISIASNKRLITRIEIHTFSVKRIKKLVNLYSYINLNVLHDSNAQIGHREVDLMLDVMLTCFQDSQSVWTSEHSTHIHCKQVIIVD